MKESGIGERMAAESAAIAKQHDEALRAHQEKVSARHRHASLPQ